jgi:hypothetical protein
VYIHFYVRMPDDSIVHCVTCFIGGSKLLNNALSVRELNDGEWRDNCLRVL